MTRSTISASRVLWWRAIAVALLLAVWQGLAMSGWFYRDVIPALPVLGKALLELVMDAEFARNLGLTASELVAAAILGTLPGVAAGVLLGRSRLLQQAYEPSLYYLAPTPKIIFFPIAILWFGVGPSSKVAMGAVSCFFPVALSVAAGVRDVKPIFVRVGRSFGAARSQMLWKVFLPAIHEPLLNGLRLGIGVALIAVLLAETKLSNRGIGFLIIESYTRFDIPRMYALLLIAVGMSAAVSAALLRMLGRRTFATGE